MARQDLPIAELKRQIERMTPFGWVVQLHIMPSFLLDQEDGLAAFDINFMVDHTTWLQPSE